MDDQAKDAWTNSSFFVEIKVINAGIEEFYNSLKSQNINVIHVNWSPPIEVDEEIGSLLDLLL